MADTTQHKEHENEKNVAVETTGCGMFDFLKKKENEKPLPDHQDVGMTDVHKSHSRDSSSSSSDEEGEDGEKKEKKKGLKDKIKEKTSTGKKQDHHQEETKSDNNNVNADAKVITHPEDHKGLMEKIKEKLPGQHKKADQGGGASAECAADGVHSPKGSDTEKKGILEKIKEKLPAVGHKNEEKGHEN